MREWWRDAVIYQIYPRSFQDDDGDGIGDLPGITRRLDHIASLGVDAIWLSPIFTSPMKDMGYDVADYRDVDPLFGTLADFDALVARAHDIGLRVIIDQVLSHTSDKHPWFEQSREDRTNPRSDWYVWADARPDGTPPSNWQSVFGGPAWEWDPRRQQYYLHNFLIEQPDLNLHNPAVQDEVLDAMRFWLDRGVDGFRLDVINYYFHDADLRDNPPRSGSGPVNATYGLQTHVYSKNRPETLPFLSRMRALTDEYDARMMVGEVGEDGAKAIEVMADYTRGADRLHMAYSFELLQPTFTAAHFRQTVRGFLDGAPDGWPCWSFSNHDVVRHVSRWADHGADPDSLARQAAALLFSFPGTIGLYQGEELGQTQTRMEYHELTDPPALRFWPRETGRDGCRTPMVWDDAQPNAGFSTSAPWLPVKPPQAARAVAAQERDPGSILSAYRAMIAWRKSRPELTLGDTIFLDLPEPVLGLVRSHDGHALTCLFNLAPSPVVLDIAGPAACVGPALCTLDGSALHLPANGFAFLAAETAPEVTLR